VDHTLTPGDQPLVLSSFASEDQEWVDNLRAFLDPKIELLHDTHNTPYLLWNFSDVNRGTTPGDEFPEIVAEKMWRCQTALILLSSDYFRSSYCRAIELPFLMWRKARHQLLCLPIRIGTMPIDRVRVPAYEMASRNVMLDDLIDDRQAADDFSSSEHRDLNLRQLQERGLKSEIEKRFEGISRHVVKHLKMKMGAKDDDEPILPSPKPKPSRNIAPAKPSLPKKPPEQKTTSQQPRQSAKAPAPGNSGGPTVTLSPTPHLSVSWKSVWSFITFIMALVLLYYSGNIIAAVTVFVLNLFGK
jgi:hypothetical protein